MTTAARTRASWTNWARTVDAHPQRIAYPTTDDEVVALVRHARDRGMRVKAIGAGHSFTAIGETDGLLLDLRGLTGLRGVDAAAGRVRLAAGTHLWELPALLGPHGLALQNMGDIDRQTISGATSTGTHGTGARFGGLATQITAATLVTAAGDLLSVDASTNAELLPAVRVGLGALGILVEVELQCVPAFLLRASERPEEWDAVLDDLDERARADHFEFYWWPHTDRVMTKTNTRLPNDAERDPVGRASAWLEDRVLSNTGLSLICSIGYVAPGLTPGINRFATRLYGDRDYTDASHTVFASARETRFRELEYAVPRVALPEALRALRRLVDDGDESISFPVEVRMTAADDNWLSTAYGRDTGYIAVHRFHRDPYEPFLRRVDALLRDFDGRPHWGKLHWQDAESLAARYPRFADFRAVRDRLDPDRVFTNPYLDRVLG